MPRVIWGTLAAAAITTALAGCGSSSTVSGASSSGGAAPAPPPGTSGASTAPSRGSGTAGNGGGTSGNAAGRPHCTSGMLSARLTDLGAAAGNRYATLVLTNESGKHCTTGGWSGLQLAGADGTIPTKVIRTGTARTITIGNGGHAYERLHWAVVPAGDETDGAGCEPEPAALKVIPPNNTEQVTANWTYGPVCQHGQIRLTPVTTNPEPR
ncbi:DUF4232 domain-containing protein [Actinomadura latina]|uniref:DUF4232 domain-containing protein n=1 Tax=Actinomadura latina TaxID=163603 RepID=A0A846Z5C0_9ACTN|nr:DUF4232 domain-containing protein [Actinomadura latina]NKZ08580.1 DUF4232 domain-containing protein [Actinomadura latina]